MSKDKEILDSITDKEYEHGFVTDVEQEFIPKGLNEDIIRLISAKKDEPEWMLEFRLNAFRRWQKMTLPTWAHLDIPEIDFQDIICGAEEGGRQAEGNRPGAREDIRQARYSAPRKGSTCRSCS